MVCRVQSWAPQSRVQKGEGFAERQHLDGWHIWGAPRPGGCLIEKLLKVPWNEKTKKCGHVIYLYGTPMVKTRDAELCHVEEMSRELETSKDQGIQRTWIAARASMQDHSQDRTVRPPGLREQTRMLI